MWVSWSTRITLHQPYEVNFMRVRGAEGGVTGSVWISWSTWVPYLSPIKSLPC